MVTLMQRDRIWNLSRKFRITSTNAHSFLSSIARWCKNPNCTFGKDIIEAVNFLSISLNYTGFRRSDSFDWNNLIFSSSFIPKKAPILEQQIGLLAEEQIIKTKLPEFLKSKSLSCSNVVSVGLIAREKNAIIGTSVDGMIALAVKDTQTSSSSSSSSSLSGPLSYFETPRLLAIEIKTICTPRGISEQQQIGNNIDFIEVRRDNADEFERLVPDVQHRAQILHHSVTTGLRILFVVCGHSNSVFVIRAVIVAFSLELIQS
jgi:hypothetical protein